MPDANPDLRALKQGDERAWDQAFQTLWRFAYYAALVPQADLTPDEAEDIAIDALAKLVPRIGTVATTEQLKALVVTIAQRQAISLARRKSAAKRPEIAVHLSALAEPEREQILNRGIPDNPLSETDSAELLALLHQTLSEVDATTRGLFLAHHTEGLTFGELSRKFNLPLGTVSVKMARGLQRIRLRLKESPALLKELAAFLR